MKKASMLALCFAGAAACSGADFVNLALNPKDISDAGMQDDTVKAGANWAPETHGYPHISASSRLDQTHEESNLTRAFGAPWISGHGAGAQLRLDLGKPASAKRLELTPAEGGDTPVSMALSASDDGFQKDIREIRVIAGEELRRCWAPQKVLAFYLNGGAGVAAKEFKLSFELEKPGKIAAGSLKLLGFPLLSKTPAKAESAASLKFSYNNPANLAFNPKDALDSEWKAEVNGYPHVTAQNYGKAACQQGYPYFVNDGYYNRRFWCQNWDQWWPNWLKVDFGKTTEFQYIKFFSTAGWNWSGDAAFVPKEIVVEASDDNFDKDIRKELRISGSDVLAAWNYQRLDEAKFIKLPKPVKARYVRFDFPGDQKPRRLLVEELEIYKDAPPVKKIERIDLEKPALGGEVSAQILDKTDSALFWVENNIRKVFKEDMPKAVKTDNVIRLSAARNESEAFQLVIRPEKELKNVSLKFSDLTGPGGQKIAADCLDYSFIGYVFVHTPSYVKWRGPELSEGKRGDWPDPLLEEKTLDLTESRNYPLWITVKTPAGAKPGEYSGTINVIDGGKLLHSAALRLNVRPFAIPDAKDRHMGFSSLAPFRWGISYVKDVYGDKFSDKEIMRAMLDTMTKNGFNDLVDANYPEQVFPEIVIKEGKLSLKTDEFDRWTEHLFKAGFRRIDFPLQPNQFGNCLGEQKGARLARIPLHVRGISEISSWP